MTGDNRKEQLLYFVLFTLLYIPFLYKYGYSLVSNATIDFPSYYSAAKITFAKGLSPYDYKLLVRDGVFIGPPYLYPPTSLLFCYPFSLLSFDAAQALMLCVSHVCILIFIYLSFFKIFDFDAKRPFFIFALVYVLSFQPVQKTIALGQINLAVLVFICLAWYAWLSQSKPFFVALPLSIAIATKTYPALLLFYFLARRRYTIVAWTVGLVGGYIGISWVCLPSGAWFDWLTKVVPSGGYGRAAMGVLSPTSPWNQSINGFLSRIFIQNQYNEIWTHNPALVRLLMYPIAFLLVATAIATCVLSSKGKAAKDCINLQFSFFLLTMFLVGPFSWEHHLTLCLPAIVFLGYHSVESEDPFVVKILVGLSMVMIAWNVNLGSPILRQGLLTLLISVKLYAALVLWAYSAWSLVGLIKAESSCEIS